VFQISGEINLVTIENKIDLQNSICVTPTGYLILSLLTDDYQMLGLEGKLSVFNRTRYSKRIIIQEYIYIHTYI